MEVAPVLIGLPILWATHRRFPLTPLLEWLLAIHAIVLIVGGHYSYALVPAGDWFRDLMGWRRNPYDRFGHLMQGFVPAILTREILLRQLDLRRRGWLFFLVLCVCLAFSAFYELLEWWAAEIAGDGAQDFLGTQGDIWDAQWDMFLAAIGAIVAQILLAKVHDRQLP